MLEFVIQDDWQTIEMSCEGPIGEVAKVMLPPLISRVDLPQTGMGLQVLSMMGYKTSQVEIPVTNGFEFDITGMTLEGVYEALRKMLPDLKEGYAKIQQKLSDKPIAGTDDLSNLVFLNTVKQMVS